MNVEQLQQAIADANIEGSALQLRYTGLINIFNAASMGANARDMDNVREQLHAVVDQILDNNSVIFMLTRQLVHQTGRNSD